MSHKRRALRWQAYPADPGRWFGELEGVHVADIEKGLPSGQHGPYWLTVQSRQHAGGRLSFIASRSLGHFGTLADAKAAALKFWEEPESRAELEERKAFLEELKRERPDLYRENPELLLIANPASSASSPEMRAELERHAKVMRTLLGSIEREGSKDPSSIRGAELMSRDVVQLEYRHVEEAGKDVVRFHPFGKGVWLYALRNGELLIRHKDGKPLWKDF